MKKGLQVTSLQPHHMGTILNSLGTYILTYLFILSICAIISMLRNLRRKGGNHMSDIILNFFSAVLVNVVSYLVCKWLEKR